MMQGTHHRSGGGNRPSGESAQNFLSDLSVRMRGMVEMYPVIEDDGTHSGWLVLDPEDEAEFIVEVAEGLVA